MSEDRIKDIIEQFLAAMRIEVETIDVVRGTTYTTFSIRTPDASMLIGNAGENLNALSYLIRRAVEKNIHEDEDRPVFIVDVNNYQTKKIQELIDSVELSARRAKLFRQNVELSPMTSYERMIVHSAFTDDPEIKTESEGDGKYRRVILKYIANSPEYSSSDETT